MRGAIPPLGEAIYHHGAVLRHRSSFTALIDNFWVLLMPFFNALCTLVLLADVGKCEAIAAGGSYWFCCNLFSPSAAGCGSVTRCAEAVRSWLESNSASHSKNTTAYVGIRRRLRFSIVLVD